MDMVRSTYSVALMKKQGLADFNAMEFAEEVGRDGPIKYMATRVCALC